MRPADSRSSARVGRLLAAPLTVAALSGCGPDLSDFVTFIDDPFGDITDQVRDLDETQLEELMSELMLRFRLYLELREAIPFDPLAPDDCATNVSDSGEVLSFVAHVDCIFGDAFDPAEGTIGVTMQQLSVSPVGVLRFELDYGEVQLGELEVHGNERITETDSSDGASVREIDLVQNGHELRYEFRAGLVDGEIPVFDYALPGPDGDVLARITNPTSAGGFVSVFLTGIDGTLSCEVRNSLWTPDRLPRGTCDNGVVFGLPEE